MMKYPSERNSERHNQQRVLKGNCIFFLSKSEVTDLEFFLANLRRYRQPYLKSFKWPTSVDVSPRTLYQGN